MRVQVLTYEHQFGVDVSVYRTKEAADTSRIELVLKYIGDIPFEDRVKVIELLQRGRFDEAVTMYCESSGENISYEEQDILVTDEGFEVQLKKLIAEAHADLLEEDSDG